MQTGEEWGGVGGVHIYFLVHYHLHSHPCCYLFYLLAPRHALRGCLYAREAPLPARESYACARVYVYAC